MFFTIKYSIESKNVSPEFREWLQNADKENKGYASYWVEYEVKAMLRGDGNPEHYRKVCQDFKAIYPDVDFKEFEKGLWIKNITSERMLSPFAMEKLKELGIDAPHLMVAKDLQTVCERIKKFAIENNLGVEYKDFNHRSKIESIDQRSMAIYDGKIARITLSSEHNHLSFDVALGSKIGTSEGHVHDIAHLSDKQFNTWMTDALYRASTRANCVYLIEKGLEREELPPDIHPYISIQERRNEMQPGYTMREINIVPEAEREILINARDMEIGLGPYHKRDTEVEKLRDDKEEEHDRKD